jgi:hypothetical protein
MDEGAVAVRYKTYTTLKSTARISPDGRLVVTLSDGVAGEAPEVQAAIAHVLAARVLSRDAPDWARQAYAAWLADPRTRVISMQMRATRARRRTLAPQGRHHDLAALAIEVARSMFDTALSPPPVAWTEGRPRAVLASFDEAHIAISVSRLLDHRAVASDTVRYLLYHELLHFEDFLAERADPAHRAPASRRRRLHPRSFTERLHRFPHWKAAEDDLARACRRRAVD